MTTTLSTRLFTKARFCLSRIKRSVVVWEAQRRFPDLKDLENPFFIVSIPGSLHLVELCLRFVPANQQVVIVANGLDEWEIDWLEEHFHLIRMIRIKRLIEHSLVIDLLLDQVKQPFGILDYDCFVLTPEYFSRMQAIEPGDMLNALFCYKNEILNLEIPETFMLYFNTPIINAIKHQYQVTSEVKYYRDLPLSARRKLTGIGIDQEHMPEEHKPYFDSLRAWYCLGLADGYRCRFVERFPTVSKVGTPVFHVGGVSGTGIPGTKWKFRGEYFWRRALEYQKDEELKTRYWDRYGKMQASELRQNYPEFSAQIGQEFFDYTEQLIRMSESYTI